MRPALLSALVGLALLAVACGTSAATPPPDAQPTPVPTVTPDDPTPDDSDPLIVDWYDDFALDLPNRWTVHKCEGDASIICFRDGDRHLGTVELGDYALADDYDGDARAYLLAHAEDFLAGMREDRAVGCPDLTFESTPPVGVDVGGEPGVKVEFRMVDADGVERERHVLYWAVHDGAHYVITAAAYDDEGCLERLGEFEPHDLGIALPYIARIVRDSPLPAPRHDPHAGNLEDGVHTARIASMDAPVRVIYLTMVDVLSGQQAVDAAREDGEIGPQDDLPNDIYIRDRAPGLWSLSVSEQARVQVYDCTAECEPVGVDLAAFLRGDARAMNGDLAVFELTVAGGEVVAITEIYIP